MGQLVAGAASRRAAQIAPSQSPRSALARSATMLACASQPSTHPPTRLPSTRPPTHLCIVCVCVEHDDGVGQHVGDVGRLEGVWVAAHVALCKLLHQPVDLLGLTRQAEARQEGPARRWDGWGGGGGECWRWSWVLGRSCCVALLPSPHTHSCPPSTTNRDQHCPHPKPFHPNCPHT